jgi:Uma2 family endonuclease
MARAELDHRAAPVPKLTYEEFLAWAGEGTWAEWVDGEVIVFMPASAIHQDLVGFLYQLLQLFVEVADLGRVLIAPFQMKLALRPSGREPDLLFVAREHLDRLARTSLDGPADLVVEVVSEDSRERDRRDKYQEYEAAGVREYWLLDPDTHQADFLGLGADGRYRPLPVDEHGVFRSAVLVGFWLRVDWLWQEPPSHLAALRAIGLLPAAAGSAAARPTLL